MNAASPALMRTVAEIVTVIVPTVGRPVLSDCLAALSEAAVRPGRVVVVDQSVDGAMRRLVDDARAMGPDAVYGTQGSGGGGSAPAGWSSYHDCRHHRR
jgi:dTDP-glucose pyrophosphorylase